MPSTNTYIIDNARIKPVGNDIKGLWVGNSESRYAMLGNTVIYDKVNYILSVNDIANLEPDVTAYTFTTGDYDSKRVHGNGDIDILSITPATHSFTANTSTANTQVTTVTVSQYDGTSETGCTLNNVTITQKKDYPVSISLTISPKEDIPASGGTRTTGLTEYNYSVKCNYKSGNNDVDITSLATITSNSSSVVGNDLGTTSKDRTKVGTISFTATYTCNGVTKTSEVNVDIYQEKNEVIKTEWNNPTVTIDPTSSTVSSTATSQVFTASATQTGTNTYTSTDTAETTNTSFTWSWASDNAAFTVTSTTTSATVTFGVNTGETSRSASITVSAVGESKTGSTSASLTQKGEEAPTGPYYGRLELSSVTLSCNDVPASGGTVYPSWAGTVYQYEYYLTPGGEETNTGWTDINSIVQVSWSPTGRTANSLGKTITEKTSLGDCVATFTGYSSKTGTKSITVYQEANVIESTEWENPVVELDANRYQFGVDGGSKTATASATQTGTNTYTSKETEPTSNSEFTWNWNVTGNGFSVTSASNTATITAEQNTGGQRNGGVFAEAVGKNKTGQTSANIYQDGVSPKPSPTINTSGVSYESYSPPTPPTPTFHMSNSSNVYDLYGNFTISIPGVLAGDWRRGTSRDMYLEVPFNITGFSGAVLKGSTSVSWPSIVRFTIGSNYYDMNVTINPSDEGVVFWTGTIPISQGDNVVISFL